MKLANRRQAKVNIGYEVSEKKSIRDPIWLLRKIELAFDILNTKPEKGSFCNFSGMFHAHRLIATYTSKV